MRISWIECEFGSLFLMLNVGAALLYCAIARDRELKRRRRVVGRMSKIICHSCVWHANRAHVCVCVFPLRLNSFAGSALERGKSKFEISNEARCARACVALAKVKLLFWAL